jgi:hypothetical protein
VAKNVDRSPPAARIFVQLGGGAVVVPVEVGGELGAHSAVAAVKVDRCEVLCARS